MKRREMMLATGAAMLGASAFPYASIAAAQNKKQKILYFTRSVGFEHPPVTRRGGELSVSEKLLTEWGQKAGLEVVCSKDGALFDGDLDQYSGFVFYTCGNLTEKGANPQPGSPMSPEGKQKFLAAIEAGKGFVGIHSAADSFRTSGIDPYIAMIGGEFITHGAQQRATMKVTSPQFPGVKGLGDAFKIWDEWYALYKFAKDLHVILVQETAGMTGPMYQRPPYPATWARMHGKGRVFYTSMGHDSARCAWTTETFQQVLMGGIAWTLGNAEADVTPNIAEVTPKANELKN